MYKAATDRWSSASGAIEIRAGQSRQPGSAATRILDTIYRRERKGLFAYLQRHVGADAAGDLLHDVFLRAAASPQLLDLANPGAFLHRIARNMLIDRARRRSVDVVLLSPIEERDWLDFDDPEGELLACQLGLELSRALDRLPVRTRRVFDMSRSENMTYREIHRELGISVAGVEYHMMKALTHLRAILVNDEPRMRPAKNNFE